MHSTGKVFQIGGLTIPVVNVEPCYRLVQIGKGLPITCSCTRCAARQAGR